MGGGAKEAGLAKEALSRFPAWGVGDAARAFREMLPGPSVSLTNPAPALTISDYG